MGGSSGGPASTVPISGMVGATPGLMTSSPYVQPWTANPQGTGPPGGYDQMAPNPTTSTYVDPAAPLVMQGKAVVPDVQFPDAEKIGKPNLVGKAAADTGLAYVGEAQALPSATGGAYGMASSSYGGPVYKDKAGKYYSDAAGKYPITSTGYTLQAAPKKGKK
jgi:hypothetical protein